MMSVDCLADFNMINAMPWRWRVSWIITVIRNLPKSWRYWNLKSDIYLYDCNVLDRVTDDIRERSGNDCVIRESKFKTWFVNSRQTWRAWFVLSMITSVFDFTKYAFCFFSLQKYMCCENLRKFGACNSS
jgi:hypothetical protein